MHPLRIVGRLVTHHLKPRGVNKLFFFYFQFLGKTANTRTVNKVTCEGSIGRSPSGQYRRVFTVSHEEFLSPGEQQIWEGAFWARCSLVSFREYKSQMVPRLTRVLKHLYFRNIHRATWWRCQNIFTSLSVPSSNQPITTLNRLSFLNQPCGDLVHPDAHNYHR